MLAAAAPTARNVAAWGSAPGKAFALESAEGAK